MKLITVELICFGNELLIGKTVNTNAHWLGKRIVMLGANLSRITTVGDNLEDMSTVVKEALSRKPDIIITSGGMGTTFDDIALAAIAKATNKELKLNEEAIELIKNRLEELKKIREISLEFTEERKRMAMLPAGATALKNRSGSAPGSFIEYDSTKIFSVPGVPNEMKAIFDYEIVKFFNFEPNEQYFERSIIVNHVPESELAAAINNTREKFSTIYFKTHPHTSSTSKVGFIEVEVHLTSICSEEESKMLIEAEKEIINIIKNLKGATGIKPIIKTQNNTE